MRRGRKDAPTDDDDEKPTRRVVISTHTIALQEQLLKKDLPLLQSVIPLEFSAVLVKGRGNYISLRRLQSAMARSGSLFPHEEEVTALSELAAWSKTTKDGSLTDLAVRPPSSVWDEVRSDNGNCLGRSCSTYKDATTTPRGGECKTHKF